MNLSDERTAPLRQFQNDQYALFLSLAAIGIPWELCASALIECRDRLSILALEEKIELSADRTVLQYGEPGWLKEFLRRKQLSFRLFPNLVLILCDLASGLERHERVEEASNLLRVAKEELLLFARENYASIGDVDKLVEMEMLMLEGQLLNLYLKGGLVSEASALFNLDGQKPYLSSAVDKVTGLYKQSPDGKRGLVHEISGFFSQAAELERDGRFLLADKYYEEAISLLESERAGGDQLVLSFLASLDYQVQCLLKRRRFDLAKRLVTLQGAALATYGSTWHRDFARYRQLGSLVSIDAAGNLDQALSAGREAILLAEKYCLIDSELSWSKSLLVKSLIDYYVLLLRAQMPEAGEVLTRLTAFENWQFIFISQVLSLFEQGRIFEAEAAMQSIESCLPPYLDSLPIEENFALSLTCASMLGSSAQSYFERAVSLAQQVSAPGRNYLKEAVEHYIKYLERSGAKGRVKRKKELLAMLND